MDYDILKILEKSGFSLINIKKKDNFMSGFDVEYLIKDNESDNEITFILNDKDIDFINDGREQGMEDFIVSIITNVKKIYGIGKDN